MTERFPVVFKIELDQARGLLLVSHGFIQFDNIGGKIQPRMSTNPNGPQEIPVLVDSFFIANTIPDYIDNISGTTLDVAGSGFVDGMTGVFDDGINTPVDATSVTFETLNTCQVVYPIATQTNPTVLTLTRPDGKTASIQLVVVS